MNFYFKAGGRGPEIGREENNNTKFLDFNPKAVISQKNSEIGGVCTDVFKK